MRFLSSIFSISVLANVLLAESGAARSDEMFDLAAREGVLTQLDGEDGCVNNDGDEGCADGRTLDNLAQVAVSPDGKSAYATSLGRDAVAVFARDRATGALTQLDGEDGCVDNDGDEGCADGRALGFLSGVALSRDGKSVYVAGRAVAVFARDGRSALSLHDVEGP